MKTRLLAVAIALGACGGPSPQPSPSPPPPPSATLGAGVDLRATLGDAGCFLLRRHSTGETLVSDAARCARPRRPHSTFKIPNSLIALDAGVLAGPDATLPIDDRYRRPGDLPQWQGPHTLRSGIAVSSVPHFRTLAVRLGAERMTAGLERLGYGNRAITPDLSSFWLNGDVRISAEQQVALVEKLATGALPVSATAQAAVRDILKLDQQGGATLYAKTGSGGVEEGAGNLGWLVGWVEKGGDLYPFALWIERDSLDELRSERRRSVWRRWTRASSRAPPGRRSRGSRTTPTATSS